jgi:hypothetical protein
LSKGAWMARIAVLSDFQRAFGPDASGEKAEVFRLRHRWWQQLAADAGWDLAVIDSGPLRDNPDPLRTASVCFIDTPLLLPADYRSLWDICRQHLAPDHAFDDADAVERVLESRGFYLPLPHQLSERIGGRLIRRLHWSEQDEFTVERRLRLIHSSWESLLADDA